MSSKANPTAIGAFVIGALAIAIGGVVALGGGKFFKDTTTYVMFFDSSVSGLRVGAPVEFRGVNVGSVTKILGTIGEDLEIQIPVYVEIGEGRQHGELNRDREAMSGSVHSAITGSTKGCPGSTSALPTSRVNPSVAPAGAANPNTPTKNSSRARLRAHRIHRMDAMSDLLADVEPVPASFPSFVSKVPSESIGPNRRNSRESDCDSGRSPRPRTHCRTL